MEEDLHGLEIIENQEEGEEDESEIEGLPSPILKQSFSEQIDSQEICKNILIIDGDYFEIGIKEMERMNTAKQCLSVPDNICRLISFIEHSAGIKGFDWKSFHSAEEPKSKKRKSYYSVLEENGFHFDIREFKSKKVKCPNNNCQHSKKSFVTRVQAEVDVAITMTTMQLLLNNRDQIKNVVFVIGDRDFYDLFKYLRKIKMNTFIFGFRKNLSGQFYQIISPDNIFYFDDSWDSIISSSVEDEFPPLTPSGLKFSEQRQINLRKSNSEVPKFNIPNQEIITQSIKKKRKKKKIKNYPNSFRKEEEKKMLSGLKDGQLSHSSTDDSLILTNGKFYFYLKMCYSFYA
jgi:uncharacterized LabA/DUF88 family protein